MRLLRRAFEGGFDFFDTARCYTTSEQRLAVAKEAVDAGLYDTLQYPFNYLSTDAEIELARMCEEKKIGFLGMKTLSGGLLKHASAAYAWVHAQGKCSRWSAFRRRRSSINGFTVCALLPGSMRKCGRPSKQTAVSSPAISAGAAATVCPYQLNTPELIRRCVEDVKEVLSGKPLE